MLFSYLFGKETPVSFRAFGDIVTGVICVAGLLWVFGIFPEYAGLVVVFGLAIAFLIVLVGMFRSRPSRH